MLHDEDTPASVARLVQTSEDVAASREPPMNVSSRPAFRLRDQGLHDDRTRGGSIGRRLRIAAIAICAVVWIGVLYVALT